MRYLVFESLRNITLLIISYCIYSVVIESDVDPNQVLRIRLDEIKLITFFHYSFNYKINCSKLIP